MPQIEAAVRSTQGRNTERWMDGCRLNKYVLGLA
ncbi:uncharacterized protein METZ01_LOCUS190324 [marine metagenome]|uniref:Uncharacterized protein n=1 Tax=marine metagenome TaxID=408172 RepID=A0A382DG58_9ZZZZ